MRNECTTQELINGADAHHRAICGSHRELFRFIAEADRRKAWEDSGARDMAAWLSMRYGISHWKARRWIACAHALEVLPQISEVFSCGELGMDKVVELTRFASPQTEGGLLRWANRVSAAAIRHRGDLAVRRSLAEVRDVEQSRSVSFWYYDEGKRFGLEADLPAAQGAVVARALDRLAQDLPIMPGEEDPYYVGARRADALVAVCSARIASDTDPDRAAVVLHALENLILRHGGRTDVLLPSPAGARVRVDGEARRRRHRPVVPSGRDPVPGRSGSPW